MRTLFSRFFSPGEVVEIRGLGLRGKNPAWEGFASGKGGIVSGYFNDGDKLGAAAAALDKAGARGVYYTANPVIPALLSRASNRLICPSDGSTTADQHTALLRWFLVDLDAPMLDGTRRPAGISASNSELEACRTQAEQVAKFLEEEHGFARALRCMSGNGYHLNYRLPDLPNDEEHRTLIKNAMAVLEQKFGPVVIDVSVVNPSRIWKFYGTTARKGDSTIDRPHRVSYIFPGQPADLASLPVTSLDTFKRFAVTDIVVQVPNDIASASTSTTNAGEARRFNKGELGPLDVERYLEHYGIDFKIKIKRAQTLYILERCLFNPDHGAGEASIIAAPTGKSPLLYQCFHSSCRDKKWKDARQIISGNKPLAEFCAGYDPEWKPKLTTGTGMLDDVSVTLYPDLLKPSELNPSIPPPEQISELEFFEVRGQRPVFVARKMVDYLIAYLAPIVCTDGFFWRYNKGVWKPFPKNKIQQYIALALKNQANAGHIENAFKIFSNIINREEQEWPAHPEYINLLNGVFNVNSMELTPHNPDFGCRTQLPVNYDPNSFSQRWCDFLKDIFPDDQDYQKRGVLMQFFGYCLLRDCRFQTALFAFGTGSNGKSVTIDVLTAMVGENNTSSLTLGDISKQFRTQLLQEKLVNTASETNLRDPLATETLKQCITGDMITVERKHGPPYQFRPYAKFIISMNDAPVIPDKSYGFGRRIMVLGFNRRFLPEERIPNMSTLLIEEIDGIFNWAIDGLRFLLKNNGFKFGDQIEKDTDEMLSTLNPVLLFTNEMAWVKHGKVGSATTDVWDCYKYWCRDGKNRALGRNRFLSQILQTYPKTEKKQTEDENESRSMRFIGYGLTERAMAFTLDQRKRERGFTNDDFND